MNEVYLGDGLYASFDGYHVSLRAPRGDDHHIVYLEPEVLDTFIKWVESLKKKDSNG